MADSIQERMAEMNSESLLGRFSFYKNEKHKFTAVDPPSGEGLLM